jgi:hypothetical protein
LVTVLGFASRLLATESKSFTRGRQSTSHPPKHPLLPERLKSCHKRLRDSWVIENDTNFNVSLLSSLGEIRRRYKRPVVVTVPKNFDLLVGMAAAASLAGLRSQTNHASRTEVRYRLTSDRSTRSR